ncbi:MAG: tRNA lysidine(34) synthetase TilS [Flavobacteriales bacterium]|nr:tRNA lysidine(34) synthetase TilS [Flavobacteriales bacterium]
MLKETEKYISQNSLFEKKSNILVALSGGIDSMVLLHILKELGYNISAAHCNFKLRNSESDDDEKFVTNICKQWNIALFVKQGDAKIYSQKHKCGIQEAAREVRYAWFNDLSKKKLFDAVAVAHNANDNIETFLINLIRGSGIKGLTGIPIKNQKVVRPLLFAFRNEIEEYAKKNKIPYRTDSSNASLKYTRNKIRLQIIPQLKELNPAFEEVVLREINLMQQADAFIEKHINRKLKTFCIQKNNALKIDIASIKKTQSSQLVLFHLLSKYHFSSSTINDVNEALSSQSGTIFFSPTHELLKDRSSLILTERKQSEKKAEKKISYTPQRISNPLALQFSVHKKPLNISRDSHVAEMDAEKISFPLTVRKWKAGDRFVPLGMKGKKKVSDFLVDYKTPLNEKHSVYVMESGGEIVWLIGYRISEKVKITDQTKNILRVVLKK